MKFNSTKCKVMHSGTNNKNFCYKLGAHQLEMVQEEKDSHLISQSHDDYHYQGEAAMEKESVILGHAGMFSSTGREHHSRKVLARLLLEQLIQSQSTSEEEKRDVENLRGHLKSTSTSFAEESHHAPLKAFSEIF